MVQARILVASVLALVVQARKELAQGVAQRVRAAGVAGVLALAVLIQALALALALGQEQEQEREREREWGPARAAVQALARSLLLLPQESALRARESVCQWRQ